MNEPSMPFYADFVLPSKVVTKRDLSRLLTELEQVDGSMTTASVRARVGADSELELGLSDSLTDFLAQNKLELSDSRQRTELIKQLRKLKDTAVVIHMTFAGPADRESLQQLVQWVRSSLHPQAMLEVGLQPALVAGVYVRTPNHIHDLSARTALKAHRDVLVKELEALGGTR